MEERSLRASFFEAHEPYRTVYIRRELILDDIHGMYANLFVHIQTIQFHASNYL